MIDMRSTVVPKSDQLNADDLIGQTKTIRVTKVSLLAAPDQPIAIHFEGDNGKPYKPGKSMRRVLIMVWGDDGSKYVGRRMTLFRDEKVLFGGVAVGGIRISHMSHIDHPVTMALTATKAQRKPFTVQPLVVADAPETPSPEALARAVADLTAAAQMSTLDALKSVWEALPRDVRAGVGGAARLAEFKAQVEANAQEPTP